MRRSRFAMGLVVLVGLCVGTAGATPTVRYLGLGAKGTHSISGVGTVYAGELRFENISVPVIDSGDFVTFCLEANETIGSGVTVYDAVVSDSARQGGIGGGSPDPLSNSTAWLYNNYLENVAGSATNAVAKDYQLAIWYLEQEITTGLTTGASALVAQAQANSAWVNDEIVVLNLYGQGTAYGSNPSFRQDVLAKLTELPAPVPAPSAIMLGSLGVMFVGWLKRHRMA